MLKNCRYYHSARNWPSVTAPVVALFVLVLSLSSLGQPAAHADDATIRFGYGNGILMVDPDGQNSVPLWTEPDKIQLDFTLFALPMADLFQLVGEQDPYQPLTIDTSGLPPVASWQAQNPGKNPSGALWYVSLPEAVGPGAYVITARHDQAGRASAIVVVARHVLAVKHGLDSEITVWASRLQNGVPAHGMQIALYDATGTVLDQAETNADGIVKFARVGANPVMAIGKLGDDFALSGLTWQWQSDGGYWYWEWPSRQHKWQHGVYLYTDRPIYRPGQTIYWHTFARQRSEGSWAHLAAGEVMTATLRDSRRNVVATQTFTVDEFGAAYGDFVLGDEPPLGRYRLEVVLGEQIYGQDLRVEAYRKPEYAVRVETPKPLAVAGDAIDITVAADYFFGQPVSGAAVKLQIYRQELYRYYGPWFGDYVIGSPTGAPVAEQTGVTDEEGRWHTNYTPPVTAEVDAAYLFVATVTDAAQQAVEGSSQIILHWNTFALQLKIDKYGFQSGEDIVAQVDARTYVGTAVANQPVTVHLLRYTQNGKRVDAQPPQQVQTDSQGRATVLFADVGQGWYEIEAIATDARNRTVRDTRYAWVYGAGADNWWYSSQEQISIMADRDSYAPGDTAQLLIQSRLTGMALVTIERDDVLWEHVVQLDGPITTVEVDVASTFMPNVFAQVHLFVPTVERTESVLWGGQQVEGRMITAQTELSVPALDKQLQVTVETDANDHGGHFGPGGEAVLSIRVTDRSLQGVAARVSVAVVDEALFAVQEDLSADLFDTFYGRQDRRVVTYDSLTARGYYWLDVGIGPPIPAPATPETSLGDDAQSPREGDAPDSQPPRRQFFDTAYWNPNVTTAPDGTAVVTVPLPDNLTTWRVLVRAVTVDTKVGTDSAQLLVTQDLIARPVLPRFAVVGDTFQVGAVAQNFSGGDAVGMIGFAADHLVLLDPANRAINLQDDVKAAATRANTVLTTWTAVAAETATSAGSSLVTTTLEAGAERDQVELPFSVKPFAAPERWATAGQADPAASERFTLAANAIREASELKVHLSHSLAMGLLDGLDALIDYPYGCVEQIMSRVLPSAVAARAYRNLDIVNPKAAELPDILRQGVQQLYGFQQEDGSWGWFYADDGGVYLTGYVLFGLAMAKEMGATVDASVLERGFNYLDSRYDTVESAGIQAFAQYVKSVAGRGDLPAAQTLRGRSGDMDPSALAFLALTLQAEGDGASAQRVLDELLARAVETPGRVFWPRPHQEWKQYDWQTMASDEKNTALAIQALVQLRPTEPRLPLAIRWLMEHRVGAGWRNTQATAFAVLGLADYIQVTGELEPDFQYNVFLNAQSIMTGAVTSTNAATPIPPLVLDGTALQLGENLLQISVEGDGILYYAASLHQERYYDTFEPVSSAGQGLTLERQYRLVEGQPRADGAYEIGDLVEVELTLDVAEELWYVLLADPIPAGFEVVNERMAPSIYGDLIYDVLPVAPWRQWGYNRKEIRDDRVDFFMTHVWAGKHRYTYLMRATTPGIYSVLPGQVYPMYREDIWARSSSLQVGIAPEKLAKRPALAGDFDHSCRLTSFDLQQVADAWGSADESRNVTGSAVVDLHDVAAVAARRGADCTEDQSLPASGAGALLFQLAIPQTEAPVGDTFAVQIAVDQVAGASDAGAVRLGGYGLALAYDPTQMRVAEVRWHGHMGESLQLGPMIDNQAGRVAFGAYAAHEHPEMTVAAGSTTPALGDESALATVIFVGQHIGEAVVSVVSAQAVDGQGQAVDVRTAETRSVDISGAQIFLPITGR